MKKTIKSDEQIEKLRVMKAKLFHENGELVLRAEKAKKIKFEGDRYVNLNRNQDLLIKRIVATKNYSDMIVIQFLMSNLSLISGLVHINQKKIIDDLELDQSNVSHSLKRLKNTVKLENKVVLAELVRDFEGDEDFASGLALHPELVIIGDHDRARLLWEIAGKQKEDRAKKRVQELIEKITARVKNSDEAWKAVKEELQKAKADESVSEEVKRYFNEEF
jgi:DNA-binding transcriptional regulator GbsR (MarR family)